MPRFNIKLATSIADTTTEIAATSWWTALQEAAKLATKTGAVIKALEQIDPDRDEVKVW